MQVLKLVLHTVPTLSNTCTKNPSVAGPQMNLHFWDLVELTEGTFLTLCCWRAAPALKFSKNCFVKNEWHKHKYCRTCEDTLSFCLMLLTITHIRLIFYNCYGGQQALDVLLDFYLTQWLNFVLYKFKIKALRYIRRLINMPISTQINGLVFG